MNGRYPGSRFFEHLPEIISGMEFPKNIRSADLAYSCGYSVGFSPTSLFICDAKTVSQDKHTKINGVNHNYHTIINLSQNNT